MYLGQKTISSVALKILNLSKKSSKGNVPRKIKKVLKSFQISLVCSIDAIAKVSLWCKVIIQKCCGKSTLDLTFRHS